MWSSEDILIISDIHLSTERGRGLFQADEQLAEFLQWVFINSRHCHLLLNGDIFDFLVDKQKETEINLDEATAQTTSIIEKHKEVFKALRLIANSEEHDLVILGGNHDPELALPVVQKEIECHLRVSCSHPPVRWLTNGEGALFEIGEAKVLIEHGDQYDSWNWIDHEALRRVVCLASRNVSYQNVYKSPPGSSLVVNRFNPIRDQFLWLSTLQPLSASILPLALEVVLPSLSGSERSQLLGAVKELRSFVRRSLVDTALRELNPRSEYWADEDDEMQLLNEWLIQYEREEDIWGALDGIQAWSIRAVRRLRALMARKALKRISGKDSFFDLSAKDGHYRAVERLIAKGTNLVVHGHTHSAKAYKVKQGLYLNTGTWGQFTTLPGRKASNKEWVGFIEDLKTNCAASFQRPTFVRISKQGEGITGILSEWVNGRAEQLSAWSFSGGQWESRA